MGRPLAGSPPKQVALEDRHRDCVRSFRDSRLETLLRRQTRLERSTVGPSALSEENSGGVSSQRSDSVTIRFAAQIVAADFRIEKDFFERISGSVAGRVRSAFSAMPSPQTRRGGIGRAEGRS